MENLNFIQEFDRYAHQLPFRSPPVPVAAPKIGLTGWCYPAEGFKFKYGKRREWNALLKDEMKLRNSLLDVALKTLKNERGQITWDTILDQRIIGRADDRFYFKVSQGVVANNWSTFARSGGVPGAVAYTNIPGGAVHTNNNTGGFFFLNPPEGRKKFLINFGCNHLTGTNVVLLVDLLVAAGNINANATGAQTVNSTALTRQYSSLPGEGIFMTFDVTTQLGGTASNITVTYTNQAGTSGRSTGAIAMTASAITLRLQPVAGGAMVPLASGDYGVRSVQTVEFSAAMGAGVVALNLYRPLLLMPTLAITTFVERSAPAMLGGIIELAKDSSNVLGCIVPYVLTSTTATGVQTYFFQTVDLEVS